MKTIYDILVAAVHDIFLVVVGSTIGAIVGLSIWRGGAHLISWWRRRASRVVCHRCGRSIYREDAYMPWIEGRGSVFECANRMRRDCDKIRALRGR